jgi:hypothetical protein
LHIDPVPLVDEKLAPGEFIPQSTSNEWINECKKNILPKGQGHTNSNFLRDFEALIRNLESECLKHDLIIAI